MINKENYSKYKGIVTIFNKTTNKITKFNNLICNGFYELLADRMINNNVSAISHFAVGNSTTAVSVSDTAMNSEIFRKEITTKSSPGTTITLVTEIYGTDAVGVWKEIGLLNASTGGTLTNHTNVDFTHTSGDVLTITWNIEKA